MARSYYSSRKGSNNISLFDLPTRVGNLFSHFHQKDYFKELLGVSCNEKPESANSLAYVSLGFSPFPLRNSILSEDKIFDVLEYLFDNISKPQKWTNLADETGFNYYDWASYDQKEGQLEFSKLANVFLKDYGVGYEINKDGVILAIGKEGLETILVSEIIEYDEVNVDSRVRNAILKWRNKELSWDVRREAIRELADVFEWLKKNEELEKVIIPKDDNVLFNIANNFAIRHHEPKQRSNYDKEIWYPWMFHFYLATYHAAIRLLKKNKTP